MPPATTTEFEIARNWNMLFERSAAFRPVVKWLKALQGEKAAFYQRVLSEVSSSSSGSYPSSRSNNREFGERHPPFLADNNSVGLLMRALMTLIWLDFHRWRYLPPSGSDQRTFS